MYEYRTVHLTVEPYEPHGGFFLRRDVMLNSWAVDGWELFTSWHQAFWVREGQTNVRDVRRFHVIDTLRRPVAGEPEPGAESE